MLKLLLPAAALTALAFPAASFAASSGGSSNSVHVHYSGTVRPAPNPHRGPTPDGAWGYYEGDYDGNRQFDEHKWNDWWHDRPDRSFPRWVQTNQNCAPERMWWSGSGWHC
jgi:hypothetical protein